MKQLTCEMCGSTELLKQDGVFVCQTCGTKYSVEEAKKIMVEGVVKVTGTIQVDRKNEIDNKLQNAIQEFESKQFDTAYLLFSDVLNIDSQNAQAIIYKALALGWQTSIHDTKIAIVMNEYFRAFRIMREQTNTIFDFTHNIIKPVYLIKDLGQACFTLYTNYQKREEKRANDYLQYIGKKAESIKSYNYYQAQKFFNEEAANVRAIVYNANQTCIFEWENITKCMGGIAVKILEYILESPKDVCEDIFPCLNEYMNVATSYCEKLSEETIDFCNRIIETLKKLENIFENSKN